VFGVVFFLLDEKVFADVLGTDGGMRRHGHPLATRYLIHALLYADEAGRKHLLSGGMPFDGDIETVYTAAWREIASDVDAMDVLGFIARAEAPMDLRLLATMVKESAIERALIVARHLLRSSSQGWSVFHNSFRLFVVAQPRTRLGSIDAEYSQRVYRDLAQLAKNAPPESAQHWLELRYRTRAGDGARAHRRFGTHAAHAWHHPYTRLANSKLIPAFAGHATRRRTLGPGQAPTDSIPIAPPSRGRFSPTGSLANRPRAKGRALNRRRRAAGRQAKDSLHYVELPIKAGCCQ